MLYTHCGDQNSHSVGIVGTLSKLRCVCVDRFPKVFSGVERMQPVYKPINRTGMSPKTAKQQECGKKLKDFPFLNHEHSFRIIFCLSAVPDSVNTAQHKDDELTIDVNHNLGHQLLRKVPLRDSSETPSSSDER